MPKLAVIEPATDGYLLPSFGKLLSAGITPKRLRYPLPAKGAVNRLRRLLGESDGTSTLRSLLKRRAIDSSTIIYPASTEVRAALVDGARKFKLHLLDCLGPEHPVAPAATPSPESGRHRLADRKWTFLVADASSEAFANQLIEALKRARPDAKIESATLADLGLRPIDWALSAGSDSGIAAALSFGIPVAAPDGTPAAEMINDDCGLILAADTTPEEFVMGIAPYLDSDIRGERMSLEATRQWQSNFNSDTLSEALADELVKICSEQ